MLVVGALGTLTSKRRGVSVLRYSHVWAAIYIVIKSVLMVYMQILHLRFSTEAKAETTAKKDGVPPLFSHAEGVLEASHYFQILLISVSNVSLLCLYVFGIASLYSKQTKQYHSSIR